MAAPPGQVELPTQARTLVPTDAGMDAATWAACPASIGRFIDRHNLSGPGAWTDKEVLGSVFQDVQDGGHRGRSDGGPDTISSGAAVLPRQQPAILSGSDLEYSAISNNLPPATTHSNLLESRYTRQPEDRMRQTTAASTTTPSSRAAGKQPMAYPPTPAHSNPPTATTAPSKAPTTTAARKAYTQSSAHPSPPSRTTSVNNKIWSTSSIEERERIKEFWLGLGENERRKLVEVEKGTVLRKMKEQQKHSCSCAVCGRKRNAIEEELEVLYEAYYDELEQYANYQQRYVSSGGSLPPPPGPGPFPGSVELDKNGAVVGHPPPIPAPPEDDEEEYEEEEEEEEFDEEEDAEGEEEDDVPKRAKARSAKKVPARDGLFTLGNGLTATGPGNILTVADDLLKNDGQKFLEMMEQLAERRMQREEEAAASVEGSSDEDEDEDEDDEDEDEDDEDEDEEEDEDDEDDDEDEPELTEDQKTAEGKRMFSIFAARLFEQRVLSAYRERVAQERQLQLLRELEDEERGEKEKEAKKANANQKKKDKKNIQRQQKMAKDEERAQRAAEKAAEEASLREKQAAQEEEQKRKREEDKVRREIQRKAAEEERSRRDAEKKRKEKEQHERDEKARAERREREERERKAKEERIKKEREAKEAKEAKRKEREEKDREDRERKMAKEREEKAEREAKEKLASLQKATVTPSSKKGSPTPPRASGSGQQTRSPSTPYMNGTTPKKSAPKTAVGSVAPPTPSTPVPSSAPASAATSPVQPSRLQQSHSNHLPPHQNHLSSPHQHPRPSVLMQPPLPLSPNVPPHLHHGQNSSMYPPPMLPLPPLSPRAAQPFYSTNVGMGNQYGPGPSIATLAPSAVPRNFGVPPPPFPPPPIAPPPKLNPISLPLNSGSSPITASTSNPSPIAPPGPVARPVAPITRPIGSGSGSPTRRSPRLGSSALATDDDEVVPARRPAPAAVGQGWGNTSPRTTIGDSAARTMWGAQGFGSPRPPAPIGTGPGLWASTSEPWMAAGLVGGQIPAPLSVGSAFFGTGFPNVNPSPPPHSGS